MTTLSGCTLVRNAVKLRYPLEASILTYYPLCNEVVISYDPTTPDGTEDFIKDLARRYPKIRPIASPWNMQNHKDGTEITIQSNVAVEQCSSEWILYVQADEAIHEGDHEFLRQVLARRELNGALFARRSFLGTLDREIPDYYARNLLRLFRNGQGCVVGDGMTCGLFQGVRPALPQEQPRMFNYSRMGDKAEVVMRSKCRDNFHHSTEAAIEANVATEYTQKVAPFEAAAHPRTIREFYENQSPPKADFAGHRFPVTLGVLMGPGERDQLAPFFWQFRDWPGEIVVLDDMTPEGDAQALRAILGKIFGFRSERYQIFRAALGGDFGRARNRIQETARSSWILMADLDERWNENLTRDIPRLLSQLERDGKLICGFSRANFVDGVLVNDLPSHEWTKEGLLSSLSRCAWPPRNGDVQHRLVRKEETWTGRIHELPGRLATHPGEVVTLRDFWILHNKSYDRQQRQDGLYKSLGQREGMPAQDRPRQLAAGLRESTIRKVMDRLPKGRLVVVETGTLRDDSPDARDGDGWSTYLLAECLADHGDPASRLYSIDINAGFIDISKRTVASELHRWISWICGDAVGALRTLPVCTIDLLYLDSSDDPREILAEFEEALPKLAPHSIVIVDDTGPYHAGPLGKGTLVIPKAEEQGWKAERIDDARFHMTVLSRPLAARHARGAGQRDFAAVSDQGR